MKNKKLLNTIFLGLAIIALITIVLPLPKFGFESSASVPINIVYYATTSVAILALLLIIIFSIINLFKDVYENVSLCEVMAALALIAIFVNILVFAASWYYSLAWGYILFAVQVFIMATYPQISKAITNQKAYSKYLKTVVPSTVHAVEELNEDCNHTTPIGEGADKSSQHNNINKGKQTENFTINASNPDIVTGEKE